MPKRVARLFDLVKQQQAELEGLRVVLAQAFLGDQRVRITVPQITGRRANQFSNLVRVLKLRAIDLHHGAFVAKQSLRRGFHDAGFSRSGGSKKQQIPDRPARRVQPRAKYLIHRH